MFSMEGGNTVGELGTYQESVKTNYPNDLPVIAYDFQAPVGEYGFIKPSFDYYKLLHTFMYTYGEKLVQTETLYREQLPYGYKDKKTPRCVLCMDDKDCGYLFINTTQGGYSLDRLEHFQAVINQDKEVINFPRVPIDIPE